MAVVVLATSGCGVAYHFRRQHILKTAPVADYGPPPPANHFDQEQGVILKRLKDAAGLQFSAGTTAPDVIRAGYLTSKPVLVWISPVQVTPKGLYKFAWKNGRIFAVLSPDGKEFDVRPGSWYYAPR